MVSKSFKQWTAVHNAPFLFVMQDDNEKFYTYTLKMHKSLEITLQIVLNVYLSSKIKY
jgi:hypothetical protein